MRPADRQWIDQLGPLIHEWVDKTATFAENAPREEELRAAPSWATEGAVEGPWAFEQLSEALPSEELRAALRIVLYWGMGGLLHAAVGLLGDRWQQAFEDRLRAGGSVPFLIRHDDEGDAGEP